MSGRDNSKVGRKKLHNDEGMIDDVGLVVASSPLRIDLILQLILSHLEEKDHLLQCRLVSKQWHALGTEELRGRKTRVPWIGTFVEGRSMLDEGSISSFIQLMDASPLIPVLQINLPIDPLLIDPQSLIRLLTYISPWIKTLRMCFLSSSPLDPSALSGEEGRKAMTWTQDLDDWRGLQFPNLEVLEVGDTDGISNKTLHRTLATSMSVVVKRVVQGAVGLKSLLFRTPLFQGNQEMQGIQRVAIKGITKALPPSLKSLGFGQCCRVDYEALAGVKLNLEELMGKGTSESKEAFLNFLDVQKTGMTRLVLHNLEHIYGPDFPKLPLVKELRMDCMIGSSFDCLRAFPALENLTMDIHAWVGRRHQTDVTGLHPHPSVRKLVVLEHERFCRVFGEPSSMISFPLLGHLFPNLTCLDFECKTEESQLTKLFTYLPRLQKLHLGLNSRVRFSGAESVLSGISRTFCYLAKDLHFSDAPAFEAISVLASRNPDSTIGLVNMSDLRFLEIRGSPYQYEYFLTKVTFHTVFRKMGQLKEVRLLGRPNEVCEPVLDALRGKGIHVRLVPTNQCN